MTEQEKDKQRLRNLLIHKMYATDEEIDETLPIIAGIVVIAVLWLRFFGD